ncbi:MAG: hypothetical protein ACK5GK_06145 [Akkermansiaceae bacterium]|jgi:hypothetical protein
MSDNYDDQNLRRLIRLKLIDWGLIALFFPGSLLISSISEGIGTIVAFGSLISMVASGFYEQTIPCPRCGNNFYAKRTRSGLTVWSNLTTSCMNCGVSLFSKK